MSYVGQAGSLPSQYFIPWFGIHGNNGHWESGLPARSVTYIKYIKTLNNVICWAGWKPALPVFYSVDYKSRTTGGRTFSDGGFHIHRNVWALV